ncbi:hypothetical protein YC2023_036996 [Brassica napus]
MSPLLGMNSPTKTEIPNPKGLSLSLKHQIHQWQNLFTLLADLTTPSNDRVLLKLCTYLTILIVRAAHLGMNQFKDVINVYFIRRGLPLIQAT